MPDDTGRSTVVVKVGGSLLDLKDLAARLRGLFLMLEPNRIALVTGGGRAADLVRAWHDLHALDDDASHWLAIRAMGLTTALLSRLLPECALAASLSDLQGATNGTRVLLSMERWIREAERAGRPTPAASWEVTSDSLAAWAAQQLGAPRLVLAKSVDAPDGGLQAAIRQGLVDARFSREARGLNVEWINLRADAPRLTTLQRL